MKYRIALWIASALVACALVYAHGGPPDSQPEWRIP
jgi:hypothetical protein